MPFQAIVYYVLIASPSDVSAERQAIPEVIHSWNAVNSAHMGIVLLPVKWETHSAPQMGDRPQAIINKQIVKNCDILLGTFWTRIGTHTGVAESGTVEEIQEFMEAGKPVMLYFSSVPVVLESVDLNQYQRLSDFKKQCLEKGLVENYSSIAELREKLEDHLTRLVRSLHPEGVSIPQPQNTLATVAEQFGSILRRYKAEWAAERDSQPYSTNEGKHILARLGSELLEFRAMLDGKIGSPEINQLDTIIRDTKIIQKHQVFLDGGKSYREFWEIGNSLFEQLEDFLGLIS